MDSSPSRREWIRRAAHLPLVLLLVIELLPSAARGQDSDQPDVWRPWVNKPSPRLAARLRHWHLKFVLGNQRDAPDKGIFSSFSPGQRQEGAVYLATDLVPPPAIQLTPVAKRTRYVLEPSPADPEDRVVTKDILATLRGPQVRKFIAEQRLDFPRLDIEKDLAVALVQDFQAALRAPNKKEHIWSINWRVDKRSDTDYVGYEAWGLFTRANGVLKPFYLAARASSGEVPGVSYYYVLAVGDLDADGIDEIIAREMVFESEQDDLEIWAWEHGAPVTIHKIP